MRFTRITAPGDRFVRGGLFACRRQIFPQANLFRKTACLIRKAIPKALFLISDK